MISKGVAWLWCTPDEGRRVDAAVVICLQWRGGYFLCLVYALLFREAPLIATSGYDQMGMIRNCASYRYAAVAVRMISPPSQWCAFLH